MSWQDHVDKIVQRRALARAQGGPEGVAKQHERGKLTVRERIDLLLDDGSFREHGRIAGGALLDNAGEIDQFTPANYVVGFGTIAERRVVVGGEDFTLKGGSPNAAGLRKSVYAEHLADQSALGVHIVPMGELRPPAMTERLWQITGRR